MLINSYGRYAAFGGTWEDWCDQNYANDPANLSKCKSWAPFAPWTLAGKTIRGLPVTTEAVISAGKDVINVIPAAKTIVTGEPSAEYLRAQEEARRADAEAELQRQQAAAGGGTVLGVSKKALMIGGGVLAAGLVLPMLLKRRR